MTGTWAGNDVSVARSAGLGNRSGLGKSSGPCKKLGLCDGLGLFRVLSGLVVLASSLCAGAQQPAGNDQPLRVAVVGLVHGHVAGFLPQLPQHPEIELVGIEEPDHPLAETYRKRYKLNPSLFYTDVNTMLDKTHPQAVLVFTAINEHRPVIEAAAAHGVSVMVEKPLTISLDDALAIRKTAREHGIHVLTNYETTWYASNHAAYQDLQDGTLGTLRKVIVRDGHQGPKEIGVGPEFLNWLTDPAKNGAGALYDFGCYGVDLMTWMTHGATPLSVTAETQTDKPSIYPHVDDDAAIVLRYPGVQAVVLGSWDWSFAVKNMEVYGTKGTAFTDAADRIRVRVSEADTEPALTTAPPLQGPQSGSIAYLVAVMRGQIESKGDLSALDTNVIVMQILDAARTSARTGKTVALQPLPQ